MKRIHLTEALTFDLPSPDDPEVTLRVRMDKTGLVLWRKAQGNLDAPRPLDPYIQVKWKHLGRAGFCYEGSRSGHFERGPAAARAGLRYLIKNTKEKGNGKNGNLHDNDCTG